MSVALLALVAGLAGGNCRAPALTIEASTSRVKQGGIVAVIVGSDQPLARVSASAAGRDVLLEKDDAGRRFEALLGVDFDRAVGPGSITFEAEGLCGDVHRARHDLAVVSGRFPTQSLKVAPAYVEPPESELDRIREDRERVARVWDMPARPRLWQRAFQPPVGSAIHDNFGARRVFNGRPRSPHDGVDIAAPLGAPVTAPAPGVVALAAELYFSGGTVILDHGAGLFTTYFHLSRIDVTDGEAVAAGRTIGRVGATGRATGPHLHWGARLHRARVNPLDLLRLPAWPSEGNDSGLTGQLK